MKKYALIITGFLGFILCLGVSLYFIRFIAPFPVKGQSLIGAGYDSILAPHQASYQLKLIKLRPSAPLHYLKGSIDYEFEDQCEGWITNQTFDTSYYYNEGQPSHIISNYNAYESKDNKTLYFSSTHKNDAEILEEIKGKANFHSSFFNPTAEVIFADNPEVINDLDPETILPVGHLKEVLAHLKQGKKTPIFSHIMFDGSARETGEIYSTYILRPLKSEEQIFENNNIGKGWRIKIAVYAGRSLSTESSVTGNSDQDISEENATEADSELPEYEMTLNLHENGIISFIQIDYPEYTIEQTLTKLKIQPVNKICKGQ